MIAEFALFTWSSSCSVFPGFEFSERTAFDCNFWRRRKSRSKWGASVVKVKGVGGDDIDCKGLGGAERGREGVRGGEPSSSSRFTARRAAGWEYTVHRLAWPSAKVSKKYPFRMIVHSVLSECQESPNNNISPIWFERFVWYSNTNKMYCRQLLLVDQTTECLLSFYPSFRLKGPRYLGPS